MKVKLSDIDAKAYWDSLSPEDQRMLEKMNIGPNSFGEQYLRAVGELQHLVAEAKSDDGEDSKD